MPKGLPAAGNKGFIVGPIHYQLLLLVGDVNTKSHGDCCRLRLFVVVGAAIPNAMLCMTTTAAPVQKAAFGRKKSPPLAVKKQLIASPLTIPNGQEFILAVFKEIVARTFPLKKVGNGLSLASLQVSRLTVGVILNLIIPSYSFLFIFLLRVTPTANRNTYSVAKIVGGMYPG